MRHPETWRKMPNIQSSPSTGNRLLIPVSNDAHDAGGGVGTECSRLRSRNVLMASGRTFSAIVDKVLSVERFPGSNVGALPEGMAIGPGALVSRAARRPKTDELVLILEPDHLMETEHLDALAGAGVAFSH